MTELILGQPPVPAVVEPEPDPTHTLQQYMLIRLTTFEGWEWTDAWAKVMQARDTHPDWEWQSSRSFKEWAKLYA